MTAIDKRCAHQRVGPGVALQIVEFALCPLQQARLLQPLQLLAQLVGIGQRNAEEHHREAHGEYRAHQEAVLQIRRRHSGVDEVIAVIIQEVLLRYAVAAADIRQVILRYRADHTRQPYRRGRTDRRVIRRIRRGQICRGDIRRQRRRPLAGLPWNIRQCRVLAVGIGHDIRKSGILLIGQPRQIAVSVGIPGDIEHLHLAVSPGHPIDPFRHILHVDIAVIIQLLLAHHQRSGLHSPPVLFHRHGFYRAEYRRCRKHRGQDPPHGGVLDIASHFHI